jgi:hypothetical protein
LCLVNFADLRPQAAHNPKVEQTLSGKDQSYWSPPIPLRHKRPPAIGMRGEAAGAEGADPVELALAEAVRERIGGDLPARRRPAVTIDRGEHGGGEFVGDGPEGAQDGAGAGDLEGAAETDDRFNQSS